MPSHKSNDRRLALRLGVALTLGIILSAFSGVVGGRFLLAASPDILMARLVMVALASLLIAGVVGWAVWQILSRRVDWGRVQVEQRLWESGPLGKIWLWIRKPL